MALSSSLKQDLLIASLVSVIVFIVLQNTVITGGWWYRDKPFPENVSLDLSETSTSEELTKDKKDINQTLEAELSIPQLNITIPIVWSQSTSEKDLQKDLKNGAIHYPGTALPGLKGNAFVSAHSSDFIWSRGDYKTAFAKLNELEVGDSDIYVTYQSDDEVVKVLQFRVTEKAVVTPVDPRMFIQGEEVEMSLVTCWPIGTSWRRLMVKTELID